MWPSSGVWVRASPPGERSSHDAWSVLLAKVDGWKLRMWLTWGNSVISIVWPPVGIPLTLTLLWLGLELPALYKLSTLNSTFKRKNTSLIIFTCPQKFLQLVLLPVLFTTPTLMSCLDWQVISVIFSLLTWFKLLTCFTLLTWFKLLTLLTRYAWTHYSILSVWVIN